MQIDKLLKQRSDIHSSYRVDPPMKRSASRSKSRRGASKEGGEEEHERDKKSSMRDRSKKNKWFKIRLKADKRKPC